MGKPPALKTECPEQLRLEGERLANHPDWGASPPMWMTAIVQADWEAEAALVEEEDFLIE